MRGLFSADFTGLFIMLLGVIGMAGEWRHRTITGTVLAAPNRLRAAEREDALLRRRRRAAVADRRSSRSCSSARSSSPSRGFDTASISTLADVLWRNLVVAALLGALGVGVGGARAQPGRRDHRRAGRRRCRRAALFGLAAGVGRFGPTAGAPGGITTIGPVGDVPGSHLLSPGIAVLVMLGWIAVFFAAAGVRLRSRDLV